VPLSRTAHSAGWDADISVQTHEAVHQYHCPDHHSVTAEIKEYWLSNGSCRSSEVQFIAKQLAFIVNTQFHTDIDVIPAKS
jgi:hypothetical protein